MNSPYITKQQLIESVPFQCVGRFVRPDYDPEDDTHTTFKCYLNALRQALPPFAYIYTAPCFDRNAKEITCGFISFFTLPCRTIEEIWHEINEQRPEAEARVRLYARTPLKHFRGITAMSSDIHLFSSRTKRSTLPAPSQIRYMEIRNGFMPRRYAQSDERRVTSAYEEIMCENAHNPDDIKQNSYTNQ